MDGPRSSSCWVHFNVGQEQAHDYDAVKRYAAQMNVPDLPAGRARNYVNVQCEVTASVIYDNPMFNDAEGDATVPG